MSLAILQPVSLLLETWWLLQACCIKIFLPINNCIQNILQSFSGKENPHPPRQDMSAKGRYQYGYCTTN